MKNKKYIIPTAALLVVLGLFGLNSATPGSHDDLAQCVNDSGALFYGAFWCSHCEEQKMMFGKSAKLLPYIECSTSDKKGQLEICIEENITSYPTWEFSDGSREEGTLTFEQLSEKTGCPL